MTSMPSALDTRAADSLSALHKSPVLQSTTGREALTLTADCPVPQNAYPLANIISHPSNLCMLSPIVLLLPFQKQFLFVVVGEDLKDHPF